MAPESYSSSALLSVGAGGGGGETPADEGDEPWSWDTEYWHEAALQTYDDYYEEDEDNTAEEPWPAMCLTATACPPPARPMP